MLDLLALTAVDGLGDEGLAHVLEQARRCKTNLEDFYYSGLERLQSYYGLKRTSAECVRHRAGRLRADAVELLERARSLDIEMIAPGDAGYPATLEEFYDGGPPLLYARGQLALLESSSVALLSSSETSSQSLTNALGLASRLAEAGRTLVTGAENPIYNVVGLAGKRAGASLIVVLHQGLLTVINRHPEREPVPLARHSDDSFDPQRTLLLSPFRLEGRWQKGNGPRRDKLVAALAKTVVAIEARPGGMVESLCREAVVRKRRVLVCQALKVAGRNLANETLIEAGAFPLVPDPGGSNCDLVLKPIPTALSHVPEADDLERRRELGQFFTPPLVARFMWAMLEIIHGKRFATDTHVIDPACGDGVILRAVIECAGLPAGNLFGVDIDETLVPLWRQDSLLQGARLHRMNGLVDNAAIGVLEGAFDVIAGNPPFSGKGLKDLLKLLEDSASAPRAENLDLFSDRTLQEEVAPRGHPLPGHERAVLEALARALSGYTCWRLGLDAEEDEESLAASQGAPGDLFAGLNFFGERRVLAGDYERMAQLVAQWPPDRLLDVSRTEVRDTLRRLASTAIEVFFTERFLRLAKPGGLIAVIVPDSILASDRVGPLRKWLTGEMDLLAVVSLPHKVFTGVGANAKTSIIFAQRLQERRPAGWDEIADFKNSPVARQKIFMTAPQLDAPGWNLEWYLKDVLESACKRREDFRRTGR